MAEPRDLHVDRRTRPGRALLRATSSIDNVGVGPVELRGTRRTATTMSVRQVVLDRARRAHLRSTRARLDLKYVPGDRYVHGLVADSSLWKLRDAAAFELWSVDAANHAVALVRRGPKIDYCLRDLRRTHPSVRSPHNAAFGACSQDPSARKVTLGTSVGWSDIYPFVYPAQWIDVTGLIGRFAFVQIADPRHMLLESNKRNNVSETYVQLPSGRVLGHRVRVAAP